MKLSVSLPDEDVAYLDAYARDQGIDSRSAVVQKAVRLLRAAELAADYEAAFSDPEESAEAARWDVTTGDGLPD
jgi:Arc/MetJ-type ribon-helix-helix transcriptional regulator